MPRKSKRLQEKRLDVQNSVTNAGEVSKSDSIVGEMNNNAEKDSAIVEEVVMAATDNSVYCDGEIVPQQDPDPEPNENEVPNNIVGSLEEKELPDDEIDQEPSSLKQSLSSTELEHQQSQVSKDCLEMSEAETCQDEYESEKLGDKLIDDKRDPAEDDDEELPAVSDSSEDDDVSEDDTSSPVKKPPPKETSREGYLEVDTEKLENRNDDSSDDSNDRNDEGAASLHGNVLTAAQKTERMKTMFHNGIAIHFAGEEMEGCRAVKTELFPHQRVALAWMFRHENKASEGMLGGILADDMGLGKSLTVIALILTNYWDERPLCKPELGFTRPPFSHKGNSGKKSRARSIIPRLTEKDVGIGRKSKAPTKKSIGGVFSKFKDEAKDTESRKKNENSFSFGVPKRSRRSNYDDEDDEDSTDGSFINDDSSDLGDWSDDADDIVEMDAKLNVDGLNDENSDDDDEDDVPTITRKRKVTYIESSEDEECSNKSLKKIRKPVNMNPKKGFNVDEDSDDSSLPSPDEDEDTSTTMAVQKQPHENGDAGESYKHRQSQFLSYTKVNAETGLKLIIPPKMPSDRNGRRRSTLLVCPTTLISHWIEQLEKHLHRSVDIKIKVHHGSSKAEYGKDLEEYDIVITTYGTLAYEYGMRQHGPLLAAKWLRIVLDEGHCIKNHLSKTYKAALNLDSLRRWIVTGTPIQNNLMEFWSLINWLNFGYYAGRTNMKYYKDDIVYPCKNGDGQGFERLQVLIDAVCLRRTKTDKRPDGSPIVNLPPKTIIIRDVDMENRERSVYDHCLSKAQNIVHRLERRGELLSKYSYIFALMVRLRQLCCHKEMIQEETLDWMLQNMTDVDDKDKDASNNVNGDVAQRLAAQLRQMIKDGITDDCSICLGDLKTPVITHCEHVFCRDCIEGVIDGDGPSVCPLCRKDVVKSQLLEAGNDEDENDVSVTTAAAMADIHVDVSSSKVNAVIKEMKRIDRDCPDDKMVVVSQFTSFLSIIQPLMKEQGFSFVRLDGSMSHSVRSDVVKVFQARGKMSPKVLLLSLKAGGVGLNLTSANHLLLLDPAWNPASEWQCFDRIHRMGQDRNVFIYKFITKSSIEGQMVEIQNKKKDLINGAFHMPEEERRRQRLDDIRTIFGI